MDGISHMDACMHACFLTTIIIQIVMHPHIQTILMNEFIVAIYHCSVDVEPLLNPMHMEYIVSFFKRTSYGYQLQQ